MRPVVSFEHELDRIAQSFAPVPDGRVREAMLSIIGQLRQRAYAAVEDFRGDLMAYLEMVRCFHRALPNLSEAQQVWAEALNGLRADYWQRYRFDPETELAGFTLPSRP